MFANYLYGSMIAVGLFLGLFTWWKLGRDEHWEEIALFDAFFLGMIVFVLAARAGYVATHLPDFRIWYRVLSFAKYPGMANGAGIVGAGAFLAFFAKSQEWEVAKAWDAAAVALAEILIFAAIGALNLWGVVWATATYIIVSRVRKQFRFYAWYRRESSTAKDGLGGMVFVGLAGIFYLVYGFIAPQQVHFYRIPVLSMAGLGIILGSLILIQRARGERVGRQYRGALLQWVNKKKVRM